MELWNRLWRDECGAILTAEAVLVGSVGVLGVVAGLSTVSHAIDGELRETAFAIRSLDQSYGYRGHLGCHSWTAGSCYIQQPVQESIADLGRQSEADVEAIRKEVEAYRQRTDAKPDDQKSKQEKKREKRKRGKKGAVIDESSSQLPESNDLPTDEASGASL